MANNCPGVDGRGVFNFLNRVFDSMKMHTAVSKVYITGNDAPRLSKMLDGKERE